MVERLRTKSGSITRLFFEVSNTTARLAVAERRIDKFQNKLQAGLSRDNAPKYFRHFITAAQMNVFPPEQMQELLNDIGASLISHGQSKSKTTKSFYINLLNSGSPWVAQLVSKNLGGPHLRTIQRWRGTEAFSYKPGLIQENMVALVLLLKRMGLYDVPGVWSEDATTCKKMLVVTLDYEPGSVFVEGFVEPVRITCKDDLTRAFAKYGTKGLATYVYVWTWVPQVPGAPYFPVFWIASNNRFDAQQVWVWQMWLFREGAKAGLSCIGDVSDGDARLRRVQYELNRHNKLGTQTFSIEHPLMFLHYSMVYGSPMVGIQDWMHLSGFRIRRLLLDGVHNFHLGDGADAGASYLRKLLNNPFSAKDLDYKEKQHWSGCIKIFSLDTLNKLTMMYETDKHVRGVLAYVTFGMRLLNCSIGDQAGAKATDRKQAVVDASFCCAFVLYWRWRIAVKLQGLGYTLKKHFLTRETFLDVLTLTQTRILLVMVYREHYPNCKIHGPNLSSRFSEHVFQYCRMHETNSPNFDVAGFRRHIKHLLLQMQLAAESKVKLPPSRRGVPNDVESPQAGKEQCACSDGWHLSDDELKEAMDQGIAECIQLFIKLLGCTDGIDMDFSNPEHFFSNPCKHFPDGDIYNAGVDEDHEWFRAQEAEREDGFCNPTDGDAVGPESNSEEQHDIAQQWAEILRHQSNSASDEGGDDVMELFKSLTEPVRQWNQSVEEAKDDRRFGRMEEQAFRSIGITGDDATVWEYLSGDDDIVMVERKDDGGVTTDYLVHGNVVDTAILQAPSSTRKKPIADIDLQAKDPRKHIPLSLDKGAVWVRKYKETCKDGSLLPGYQNKRRGNAAQKYWKLPMETGEPLEWWPTQSVLGHCRMKRVDGLEMCYDRVPSDFKTLVDKYHDDMEASPNDQCFCVKCNNAQA